MAGVRGKSGAPRREVCINEHDLTVEANVAVVQRKHKNGSVYVERQCVPCRRDRSRKWWVENRGADSGRN